MGIHPTAVVHPSARINPEAWIGPYCVIGPGAVIGAAHLESNVCVSSPPEGYDHFKSDGKGVYISDGCVLREFVTVNSGIEGQTFLGPRVVCLRGAHVGHDAVIGEDVMLACNVLIGGHATVGQHSNLGLGAIVHQRVVVPSYCMIGMGGIVTKASMLLGGYIYAGNPVRMLKVNEVGLERWGITLAEAGQL